MPTEDLRASRVPDTSDPRRFARFTEVVSEAINSPNCVRVMERSSDPADPPDGQCYIWMSDGTDSGDDGDILVKITAGGVTATGTLVDYSGL